MIDVKIRKFGNSLGVILPKDVLSALFVGDGSTLHLLQGPDGSLILTPHDPAFAEKMAKADSILQRYRNTLHTLAQ